MRALVVCVVCLMLSKDDFALNIVHLAMSIAIDPVYYWLKLTRHQQTQQ